MKVTIRKVQRTSEKPAPQPVQRVGRRYRRVRPYTTTPQWLRHRARNGKAIWAFCRCCGHRLYIDNCHLRTITDNRNIMACGNVAARFCCISCKVYRMSLLDAEIPVGPEFSDGSDLLISLARRSQCQVSESADAMISLRDHLCCNSRRRNEVMELSRTT
jgi:hypothetical protein